MNDQTTFRDKLLVVEPLAPDIRRRLEQEIYNMRVHKLQPTARIFMTIVSLFALASAGVCGYLAMTEETLPLAARIGLGTGMLFGLAWFVWTLKILRTGELNLSKDPRVAAQMVWVFTVLMVVFFLIVGMSTADRLLGVLMILQSLAFLIGAAVYWLSYRIEAAELNLKEQLLRTEMQITELLERK